MNNYRVIGSFDGTFWKDKLLLTGLGYGALFEYDFQEKNLSLKYKLPEECEIVDSVWYGETLYLFPFFEFYVYALHLETEEIKTIEPQGTMECKGSEKTRINRPIVVGDKVYIFPVYSNRELMILDLNSENLTVVEGWWELIKQHVAVEPNDEFMTIYAFDKFWVMKDRAALILSFGTNFELVGKCDFGDYAFYGINADKDGLWIILHDSGDLVHWDITSNETTLCKGNLSDNSDFQYSQIVSANGSSYALPYNNEQIVVADKGNKSIYALEMPQGVHRVKGNVRPLFNKYIVHKQKLYLIPLASNCLLVLDLVTQKMERHELVLNETLTNKLINANRQDKSLSEKQYSLQEFIRFVAWCKTKTD